MQRFEVTERAYLLIENGRFASFGPETALTADMRMGAEVIDAQGGTVMPSWCDAHTHIVYAGSREGEFVDKIRGLSYEEIAELMDASVGAVIESPSRNFFIPM